MPIKITLSKIETVSFVLQVIGCGEAALVPGSYCLPNANAHDTSPSSSAIEQEPSIIETLVNIGSNQRV